MSRGKALWDGEGNLLRVVGSHTDITERRQAEQALRESEEKLKLFIEHAPASIAMFDHQMHYIGASQQWVEDFNLKTIEDLIGKSHYEVISKVPNHWRQIHQRCLAGNIEKADEDLFIHADGSQQWIRWEKVNEALAAINGHSAADHVGKTLLEILPEVAHPVIPLLQTVLATGESALNFEVSGELPNQLGTLRSWLVSYFPVTVDAVVSGLGGIVLEITDRKKAELALRQSEATNRALIEALPDFLMRMRQDGIQLKVINEGAIHCRRASAEQTHQHTCPINKIMPLEVAQERIRLAQKAIATRAVQLQEYEFTEQGQTYYEEARITPLWDDEVLVIVRDITERKRSEAQLQNLSTRLKLAVQAAQIGIWDWDIANDRLVWDEQMCDLYGISPGTFHGAYESWESQIHSDDLPAVQAAGERLLIGETNDY